MAKFRRKYVPEVKFWLINVCKIIPVDAADCRAPAPGQWLQAPVAAPERLL